MAKYLEGTSIAETRQKLGISAERFRNIYASFTEVANLAAGGRFVSGDDEELQWASLATRSAKKLIEKLKETISPIRGKCSWDIFGNKLVKDLNLSPIKLLAIKEAVEEILSTLLNDRANGDIIYWTISASEPAGKPLEMSKLVLTVLTLYDPADMPTAQTNRDLNRVL